MKFQNKITFSILSLILFFGALASITTFYLTRNEFTKQLTANLVNNTFSQSQEVYQILRQSRDLAVMLADRTAIREYFTSPKTDSLKELQDHYLDGLNLADMYLAIYLLDANGLSIVSTDPRFVGQDYSFRNYVTKSKNGEIGMEIANGSTSSELGYYFSAPIYSLENDREVVGITVFKLDPKFISTALLEHVKPGYNIMLSDEFGIIFLSSDESKKFSSLGKLPQNSLNQLQQSKRYDRDSFATLDYDVLMQEVIAGNEISKTIKIMDKYDDEEEVVSIAKIQDFPFYMVFEGDLEEITHISLNASLVIAAFVATAALASIVIIILVIRIFIGQQQKIEDELRQRTSELEKLNSLMVNRELKMLELKTKIAQLEGDR